MAEALNLDDLTCVTTDSNADNLKQLAGNTIEGASWNIPKLPHNKDFHLFVCYIQDNSSAVRQIVDDLEREGMKCCYHERDFLPGQQVITNINDAIEKSMSILVVLSETFVQSRFCLHEIEQALHARISQNYTIIPIKVEPCDVPVSLQHITYIDAEMIPASEMYVKILDAFVWNVWHREQNMDSNGFTLAVPLSKYTTGWKWISPSRLKMEFDDESRQTIRRNNFEISDEILNGIQTIVSNSVHVKYAHIIRSFLLLTSQVFGIQILLSIGIVFLIHQLKLDSTFNKRNTSFPTTAFVYTILVAFLLWVCLIIFHNAGVTGRLKKWKGMTYSLEERSKNRLKQDIWRNINSRYAETNKLITIFQNMAVLMMRYDFKPCQDVFVRRCDRNETLKKRMFPQESLQDYTRRLFRDYMKNSIDTLFVKSESYVKKKASKPKATKGKKAGKKAGGAKKAVKRAGKKK